MADDLKRLKNDLGQLKRYLQRKGLGDEHLDKIVVEHDADLDEDNYENPRNFCMVQEGSHVIRCSLFLNYIARDVRIGILLHEISHIINNAFEGAESEVDADLWITEELPETGYRYQDVYFTRAGEDKCVLAEKVETVSFSFMRKLNKHG